MNGLVRQFLHLDGIQWNQRALSHSGAKNNLKPVGNAVLEILLFFSDLQAEVFSFCPPLVFTVVSRVTTALGSALVKQVNRIPHLTSTSVQQLLLEVAFLESGLARFISALTKEEDNFRLLREELLKVAAQAPTVERERLETQREELLEEAKQATSVMFLGLSDY